MKALLALPLLGLVSCGTISQKEYQSTRAEQQKAFPKFNSIYWNGQTPEQVRRSIRKAGFHATLWDETRLRPSGGWPSGTWEHLHEKLIDARVARVDLFAFGGSSGLGAVVDYHRVYYNEAGRSVGWYLTKE